MTNYWITMFSHDGASSEVWNTECPASSATLYIERMEASILRKKIIDFLSSLPNIHDSESQRAFIYRAGLDAQLQHRIVFGKPPDQFVPLLVATLVNYGRLKDGRYALEAILEAAKDYVGQDKQLYCEHLLKEIQTNAIALFSEDSEEDSLEESRECNYPKRTHIVGGDNIVGTINNVSGGQIAIGKNIRQVQGNVVPSTPFAIDKFLQKVGELTGMIAELAIDKEVKESLEYQIVNMRQIVKDAKEEQKQPDKTKVNEYLQKIGSILTTSDKVGAIGAKVLPVLRNLAKSAGLSTL